MASAPKWKIYDSAGIYQAACKEPEAAACLVSFYGNGATIRDGHAFVVWVEGLEIDGKDGIAAESYDTTAETIIKNAEK